ncbi:MAG: amidohydrolase family protein [Phycisphaerales bacterium]|nr:amidohydrolase family protein [Phycisphaerales bacterium]
MNSKIQTQKLASSPLPAPPRLRVPFSVTSAFTLFLACAIATTAQAQVAIKAKTIHTMAGPAITDGIVVITDGRIAAVGPAASTQIPAGYETLTAEVLTPGLIDARGTVGLTGIFNSRHDSDQIDPSAPIQPELRAIDAYNPQEKLIQWVREFGTTTVNTGHAPGSLITGQTIIVKTTGNTVEEALVKSPAMVSATLGPSANEQGGKAPGTRGKQVAMLREELLKARDYIEKKTRAAKKKDDPAPAPADSTDKPTEKSPTPPTPPDRNLHLEMLADVLEGKVPLLVHANRAQDIESALRLKQEFGFRLILESAAEAYLLAPQIKEAGVDVILHPSMQRAVGDSENQSFETAAVLVKAGIRFAIESGYESYVPKTRVVLFEAAIAASNGLTFDQALGAVTIEAARILGIDQRVGSIQTGKDADLALFSGDPFEYTTHCTAVIVGGTIVSRVER